VSFEGGEHQGLGIIPGQVMAVRTRRQQQRIF
jgi:hypothetical protein